MQLPIRGLPFEVPSYSLTGDIISFQRCGLQYRYYNRSSLPPSRPVQLWTGEFVHGVLEEAFLQWKMNHYLFPWPCSPTPWPAPTTPPSRKSYDIGELGDQVEARLRATGKSPRNGAARDAAYRRVDAAINSLGPHLFPLITSVEESLSSTRLMPPVHGPQGMSPRGDRYELTGRVDVISSVSLSSHQGNPLVEMLQKQIPDLAGQFDVIVDYKAARRPPVQPSSRQKDYWQIEAWQIQTYAWLRKQQPSANPVKAGILVYIDELRPSESEIDELKNEVAQSRTDIIPDSGSVDYYALHSWYSGAPMPNFTPTFLLERAIRIVPVDTMNIQRAVSEIDKVVSQIETNALKENASGVIPGNWDATGDDRDCDACDFRRFCPGTSQARKSGITKLQAPEAPG
jgi:hypothetical protein